MTQAEDSDTQLQTRADPPAERFVEPDNPLPPTTLDELPRPLREAVARAGWPSLMPVQSRAIPYLLAGRDLLVQSRTGSGKTGAFVLPILHRIDPNLAACQALALVPTRELAMQVTKEAQRLAGDSGPRTVPVYGGVSYGPQLDGFKKGAHFVVGTPGRILDHLLRGTLRLENLKTLVIDEADRMLSMGFYPDMRQLKSYLPRKRTGYMFSATYTDRVRNLAGDFLNEPGFLSLSRDIVHVTDTEHAYYFVEYTDKDRALVRVIEIENPDSAIIFCNKRQTVNFVATVLQRFGYDADQLTSDLSQSKREQVLSRVREGKLRFLVATDVVGRGIDISDLSHVIQYDFPEDLESYIHRAGRTGRAGASGTALIFVTSVERTDLRKLTTQFNLLIEQRPLPTDQDVESVVAERLTALLEARLRGLDRLKLERMKRMLPLARALGEDDEELSVVAMLLDEYYQESLHALPEKPAPASSAAPAAPARTEERPRDSDPPRPRPRPRGGRRSR